MAEEERKKIKCSKCEKVLAVVQGNDITIVKYHNSREQALVRVRVQYDAGGRFDIYCDSCDAGGGFSFGRVQKTLSSTYVVKPKEPVDKKDFTTPEGEV